MAKQSVQILGLKELDRKMRELTKATGKNFLAPALRKAANEIKNQAIQNVPVDGTPDNVHIRQDIKVRRDPNPMAQGQNEIMYVRPYHKKRKKKVKGSRRKSKDNKSTYYWHMVEFGTIHQAGQRFMTKAYLNKRQKAVQTFKKSLSAMIIRETKRLKK